MNILVDRELYEKLLEVAPEMYGRVRGSISYIVEMALRLFLESSTQTHANGNRRVRFNPKLHVREVYQHVKDEIARIMNVKTKSLLVSVPEKILDKAIMEVRGSDPRTVEKWKNIFLKSGLIKYLGGYRPNRVFELV